MSEPEQAGTRTAAEQRVIDDLLKNCALFEDPSAYEAGVRDAVAVLIDLRDHDRPRDLSERPS